MKPLRPSLSAIAPEDGTLRVTRRKMADGGQPYQTILAAPAVPITEVLNLHLIASEQVPARLLTDVRLGVAAYVERLPGGDTPWEPWELLTQVDAPVHK